MTLAEPTSMEDFETRHLQEDLKCRSVRGGLLTITSQGGQFLLQTVSTITLARLLIPADFGMVAMVTAITGLAAGFSDLGLSEATIQREKIDHNQISTLFWINVAVGLGLMLFIGALAYPLARFYREPRLVNITLLLSSTFLISGLRVQHNALLKRQMRFSAMAIRDVAANALGVAVAVSMAWRGAGYWAIVALPLTVNFTQMMLSWWMVKWRPGLPSRDAEVRSMLVFGSSIASTYLLYQINRSADNVLLGRFWGANPLGLYSRAMNLLLIPVRQLTIPLGAVAIPTFSRIQADKRLVQYYLGATSLIIWLCAPLFAFLAVAAKPIIVLVLGARWSESAPVFQILTISALSHLLLEMAYWLLISRGRSDRLLKLGLIVSPVTIGSYVAGLPWGIKGVALSYSLAMIGTLPWVMKFAFHETELNLRLLGQTLLCPMSVSLASGFFAEFVVQLSAPKDMLIKLMVIFLSFAVVCSLSALIPRVREEVLSFRTLISDLRMRPSPQTSVELEV